MIDEKRIKEAESNVKIYLQEGFIKTKAKDEKIAKIYLEYAENSLQTAQALYKISKEDRLKEEAGLPSGYESFLWVIVSSYYSMFYAVSYVLLNQGIKVGAKMVHKVTADCLINFLYLSGKIEKSLLDDFNQTKDEAMELMQNLSEEEIKMQIRQKAIELVKNFDFEMSKRGRFQYNMNESLKEQYAKTSLERARGFLLEMKKLI